MDDEQLLMHTRNNMDYFLRYWGDAGAEFTLEHVFGENWQEKLELLLRVTERKD